MRYRVTIKQVEMLIEGKPLSMGGRKIYANGEVKESLKLLVNANALDSVEIYANTKNGLEIERK